MYISLGKKAVWNSSTLMVLVRVHKTHIFKDFQIELCLLAFMVAVHNPCPDISDDISHSNKMISVLIDALYKNVVRLKEVPVFVNI